MQNDLAPATAFSLPVRVYYEDTDAGGVVYYANYLKFFERCRTEWARHLGCDQAMLLREHGMVFVVRNVEAEYRQPARLDDLLTVTLTVEELGRAQILLVQTVCRGDTPLVVGKVRIVCAAIGADNQLKAAPIPKDLRQQMESYSL
ncbi:MAG: tol-pal system-associated acyl-CoA thioesterase [Zoogloeaceae bacterium]|jgi:acyl-CoA thioester hydrolase|nr:tol-pal system-associated acyl-CoA thioesterase [Zoogloeaceae bacterium]